MTVELAVVVVVGDGDAGALAVPVVDDALEVRAAVGFAGSASSRSSSVVDVDLLCRLGGVARDDEVVDGCAGVDVRDEGSVVNADGEGDADAEVRVAGGFAVAGCWAAWAGDAEL